VNRDVISEEREQLRYSLASLTADYELINGAVDNPLHFAHVIEGVDARHCVDTKWLADQKAALAAFEVEDAAQLAYEQRERTTVTARSCAGAYEPAPTIDRGFSVEPESQKLSTTANSVGN
jgi:hypothetical protein